MKRIQFTIIICLTFFVVQLAHSQSSFSSLKQTMETRVKDIVKAMQDIFREECSDKIVNCQRKSYNQCQGTGQRKCFKSLPTSNCGDNGILLSKQSTIGYPLNSNPNNLTRLEKWITCASAYLEETFTKQGEIQFAYQYIGTHNGSMRIYPSNGQCVDFDPRYRPWYATAATGAKNVILFIDISGSMSGLKLRIAKEATKAIIDTLGIHDFVGVVTFNGKAERIQKNLMRATSATKENLKRAIEQLSSFGQTNYKEAFQEGFQLLENSIGDEYGRQCPTNDNIFLFLTDGSPYVPQDYTDSESLKQLIRDLKVTNKKESGEHKIRLFTYGLDKESTDFDLLKNLSCEFDGIAYLIDDKQGYLTLINAMKQSISVLEEEIRIEQPIWNEPYDDINGFGKLISVSMPIRYKGFFSYGYPMLFGVATVEIPFSKFEQFGTQQEIMAKLIQDYSCPQSKMNYSDHILYWELRYKIGCSGGPKGGWIPPKYSQNCRFLDNVPSKDIFHDPVDNTVQICCPSQNILIKIFGAIFEGIKSIF